MKLSIIIVNYNVRYFLEQALLSVKKAIVNIPAEIFVVDNNSVDGSVTMLREKFPEVILIENKENKGFSFANNQAIRLSKGEYVLLLNPDTLVEEDTFEKTITFMETHPDAGGVGVRMIDGAGKFLPESKRGLPTPLVAFFKVFGLSALFPGSRLFGKYHLGFLDQNKIHEVDVLSGAFMLLRHSVLDKIGLLDESYFMYGEDIDLSYRILQGGYKNFYFPETRIIHYKGESTKKSSVNYVLVFYKAMILFASKHFSKKNASLFSFVIHVAIYLRAAIAIAHRMLSRLFVPLVDFVLLFAGMFFFKYYWEHNVKVGEGLLFPPEYMTIVVPCYILVWLLSVNMSGGYITPVKIAKLIRGILVGTVIILVVYALLSEEYRYSRTLILLGAAWASMSMILVRYFFGYAGVRAFSIDTDHKKRVAIIGEKKEGERVLSLLTSSGANINFIGYIRSDIADGTENNTLGDIRRLSEVVEVFRIEELIFCAADLSSQKVIGLMSDISGSPVEYKIAPPESLYIIGSNSVDDPGSMYRINVNDITKKVNARNKRMLDIVACILFLCVYPVCMLFVVNPFGLLRNILLVLFGKRTWVGYSNIEATLPPIRKGILFPSDAIDSGKLDDVALQRLNALYALDYRVERDIQILVRAFRQLGRSS